MSQVRERTTQRPVPDEAVLTEEPSGSSAGILRTVGAFAVLIVGAVHLQQYLGAGFDTVSVIGTLFVLNFAGATVLGLGLLVPALRRTHVLLALGGIGLAATSFVFLFVSEHQPLFGFHEHGYRAAIVIALVAEAVAVVALTAYLAVRGRSRT